MAPPARTVPCLLDELEQGNRDAVDELVPLVYDELRRLAHLQRRSWTGDETLGTTALVNEAYLKLVGPDRPRPGSHAHFLGVAAKAMRHILSDYARARRRGKRGGGARPVSLAALDALPFGVVIPDAQVELVAALDAALTRLAQEDARLSRVVECRFFGGMSIADTATALGISPATVKRDWTLARAWLYRELAPERAG